MDKEKKFMILKKSKDIFDKLTYPVLSYLCLFLNIQDILSLKNRKFIKILLNPLTFPEKYFSEILYNKLIIKNIQNIDNSSLNELNQSIIHLKPFFLPFVGIGTNGGFKNEISLYNYSNIFRMNNSIYISSFGNFKNVDIYAILCPKAYTHQPFVTIKSEKNDLLIKSTFLRLINNKDKEFLLDIEALEYLIYETATKYPTTVVDKFLYYEHYKKNYNENIPGLMKYSVKPIYETSYDDTHLLKDITDDQFYKYSYFISNVYFNNVSNYSCPVNCFMVFRFNTHLSDQDRYNMSLFNSVQDYKNLKKVIENKYSLLKAVEYENYILVEFKPTIDNLTPLFWIYAKYRKIININMTKFIHTGRFIAIKLISVMCDCKEINMGMSKLFFFGNMIKTKK